MHPAHPGSAPPPELIGSLASPVARALWLKRLPVFADAALESLELFAAAMREHCYAPGAVLCNQGDRSTEVYVVVEGDVEIRIEHDGRLVATDRIAAGSCVGEMAVLTGQPRSATVVGGAGGARALIVPGTHFRNLLLLQPAVGVHMLAVMSQRLRQTELRKKSAELARRADELTESKAAAEAASRAKSDFLAGMSHEIRTPLNGIIGLTELVLETQLTATQRDYLSMVRDSGETLLSLINDVLDFSKIEAGRLELEALPFALRDRLGDTLKPLAVRAHRKGLELACRVAPEVPDDLVGDLARLRQIIVNLVGNALKFTERGEIVVTVKSESRNPKSETNPKSAKENVPDVSNLEHSNLGFVSDFGFRDSDLTNQAQLHFSVRDTGIGIPKEKIATLFEAYTQADATIARRYGGTGLGLSISARLVELMGGRIWAESEVGQGTTFHFTATLARPGAKDDTANDAASPGGHAGPATLAGTRALIADRFATTRAILDEMLRVWGVETIAVADFAAALDALQTASSAGRRFDWLLLDVKLEGSFALVERLRVQGGPPIIMLVWADGPDDVNRCDELAIPHLLKPVKHSELQEALTADARAPAVAETAPAVAAVSRPPTPRKRILLAEDNLINQRLAVALLEKEGHQVVIAGNGRQALAALERSQERRPFDLVLMDVMMPEMDGLEAAAAIRAREKETGGRMPIIAMTAHALEEDSRRCLAAGMDAFLSKPIRPGPLRDAIARVGGDDSAPPAATGEPPAGELTIDWSAALSRVGGSRELLHEMAVLVQQECPRLLDEISAAVAQADPAALQLAAHTLKGSVSLFVTASVVEHAQELELMGKAGSLTGADAVLASLRYATERLLTGLQHVPRG